MGLERCLWEAGLRDGGRKGLGEPQRQEGLRIPEKAGDLARSEQEIGFERVMGSSMEESAAGPGLSSEYWRPESFLLCTEHRRGGPGGPGGVGPEALDTGDNCRVRGSEGMTQGEAPEVCGKVRRGSLVMFSVWSGLPGS